MEDTRNKYWDWECTFRFLLDSALSGPNETAIFSDEIGDFLVSWGLGNANELDEEWPEFKKYIERHG